MYAQEECFTQCNYFKPTSMDKISCLETTIETLDESNPEIRKAKTFVALNVVETFSYTFSMGAGQR